MYRQGHFGVALVIYAPVVFVLVALGLDRVALLGSAGVLLGAMLPDYDRYIPLVNHRRATHTDAFALVIGGLYALIGAVVGLQAGTLAGIGLALFGFVIGALSIAAHIAADALTPSDVEPFGEEWVSFEITRAGNTLANWILLGLGIFAVGGGYLLGQVVTSVFG